MKRLFAQDSKRLIVIDENVKHRGLFSWVLLRVISLALLGGLMVYGIIGIPPKVMEVLNRIDNVRPDVVMAIVFMTSLVIVASWIILKTRK